MNEGRSVDQVDPQPISHQLPLDYVSPENPSLHARGWMAYASVVVALFQVPWSCGGLYRPLFELAGASWEPVDHTAFMIGRAMMVAPAVVATILACVSLVGSRKGSFRVVARFGMAIALVLLFLSNYAMKWHAGD